MTDLERVARAIAPKAWATYGLLGVDTLANVNRRTASLKHARAAVAALMEPSSEMLIAGQKAMARAVYDSHREGVSIDLLAKYAAIEPAHTKAEFQAMLRAVLEEGE
jgi:hypothetical protein